MYGKEFRVILLAAGSGSRMRDITNNKPKCLLPVGNCPLIWFPLSLLEREGFQEVTIITLDVQHAEVKKAIEKLGLRLECKYYTIRESDDLGTADALKKVAIPGEWKEDVIVLGCDFVTDQSLSEIINLHRTTGSGVTSFFFPSISDSAPVPGPKSKNRTDRDLVVLDKHKRLLMLTSAMDHDDSMNVRMRLLRKFGSIEIKSRLTDGHFFIINNRVWNFIISEENSDMSLKGEVLPYIIKQQMSRLNKVNECQEGVLMRLDADTNENDETEETHKFFKHFVVDELQNKIDLCTGYHDHPNSIFGPYLKDRLRCFAYIAPTGSSFKVNNLVSYCEINRQILSTENWERLARGRPLVRVDSSCTSRTKRIESSLIGANCSIGEGSKIERSSIGSSCTIEQNVTISGSVLMDGVTIKEGTVLTDCLICDRAVVGTGCQLKSCLVDAKFAVAEKVESSFKVLSGVLMSTDE
ncbi:translation initiation factor eIF-2B subunit gamma [Neocloeon triangulifer]|uniref:translation initiation factor eIF-2B subunit gamma n=1 Tax=Neocloeon triangulifer TaxID=2078957 RepID=UPI00286EEE3E|nr:translation initiation factor eIF-2B subunit gamma [Neocloeon triangulifer]